MKNRNLSNYVKRNLAFSQATVSFHNSSPNHHILFLPYHRTPKHTDDAYMRPGIFLFRLVSTLTGRKKPRQTAPSENVTQFSLTAQQEQSLSSSGPGITCRAIFGICFNSVNYGLFSNCLVSSVSFKTSTLLLHEPIFHLKPVTDDL